MKSGFLCLQTHLEHPGLVRIVSLDKLPALPSENGPAAIRYVACFNDLEAGEMHLYQLIRRGLWDLEHRLYRGELEKIIADLESVDLEYRRIWMDPSFGKAQLDAIARRSSRRKRERRYRQFAWHAAGAAGVLLLLLLALTPAKPHDESTSRRDAQAMAIPCQVTQRRG